jgi:hypothetical protein
MRHSVPVFDSAADCMGMKSLVGGVQSAFLPIRDSRENFSCLKRLTTGSTDISFVSLWVKAGWVLSI